VIANREDGRGTRAERSGKDAPSPCPTSTPRNGCGDPPRWTLKKIRQATRHNEEALHDWRRAGLTAIVQESERTGHFHFEYTSIVKHEYRLEPQASDINNTDEGDGQVAGLTKNMNGTERAPERNVDFGKLEQERGCEESWAKSRGPLLTLSWWWQPGRSEVPHHGGGEESDLDLLPHSLSPYCGVEMTFIHSNQSTDALAHVSRSSVLVRQALP
jgi:hypothetical protein